MISLLSRGLALFRAGRPVGVELAQRAEPSIALPNAVRPGVGYDAARVNRLTVDWLGDQYQADNLIRRNLPRMRARSRELARNNDYLRGFLKAVRRNIVGPHGVTFEPTPREREGAIDKAAAAIISREWKAWGRRGNCTPCGRLSWRGVERTFIEAVARDGEALLRELRGFKNRWGYAVQPLEADYLDVELNRELDGGAYIRMGIEFDKWNRPLAYWLLTKHPGNDRLGRVGGQKYERVPADEIIHGFVPDRVDQSRGVPWCVSAMTRLNMLGGYEEAALIAARIGASKMGFYEEETADGYAGEGEAEKDKRGNLVMEVEPGSFERLPKGVTFKAADWSYPQGEMPSFVKLMLRGAAAGLGVSYNTHSGDLEAVNFSSGRLGLQQERDEWETLQDWLVETLHDDVFPEGWLPMALLSGALDPLPFGKLEKFKSAVWQPRGWPFVDPEGEINAATKAIALRVDSRRALARRQGRNIETVFAELAADKAAAAAAGIELVEPTPQGTTASIKPEEAGQGAGAGGKGAAKSGAKGG